MGKAKICFVALDCYPVLRSDTSGHFGGAQVQQVLIAKELLKRGCNTTFITASVYQQDDEIIDGIKVLKAFNPNDGIRFIRFIFPRLLGIWKALKSADAQIYYQRSAGFLTGVVGVFCKLMRRRFVFATSSDFNINGGFSSTGKKKDTVSYHLGLKLADRIVVQSRYQKKLLEHNYGHSGKVIPNVIEISDLGELWDKRDYVLWVGNLYRVKQPELFIKLAARLPEHQFMIAGRIKGDETYQKYVKKLIDDNANLTYLGPVPHNQVIKLYDRAYCLVNTSKYEGFPNTFLEAWSRKTPVVSMNSNPDGIITEYGLGYVVNSLDDLTEKTIHIIEEDNVRKEMGEKGYSYILKNCNIEDIAGMYDAILKKLNGIRYDGKECL